MLRTIAIVSGKGGVGKTTTAINLSHAMSAHNKKTILVDGNISTPNVHLYLGWPILKKTLVSVLKSEASHAEAIYTHPSGLRVLPSISTPGEIKKIKLERLSQVIKELESETDLILIDSAAGIGNETLSTMESADEILIITNPELAAVVDAQKIVQLSHEMGKLVLGVILNKVRHDKYELTSADVERLLSTPVIGVIPFDNSIRKAMKKNSPVTHSHPGSKSSQEYEELASMLLGKKYMKSVIKKNGLRDYILNKLGFK